MSFLSRLFKFRIFKFRTTLSEELEDLHSELTNLHKSLTQTRLRQKQWTKLFAIYAILIYLILNIGYYAFFFPKDIVIQAYVIITSVIIGILLYGIHWIIRWYFRRIIQTKEEKISLFNERKGELIEEVKNKETYAVAKNLLEKYGEKITPEVRSPIMNDPNQRISIRPSMVSAEKPMISVMSPNAGVYEAANQQVQTPVRAGPTRLAAAVTPGKLPRDILPPQRTFWSAILDTIVGDGPSKRYALICKSCNSHNGMALEEEFEYLSFRCAYCNYLNGARKHKPVFNPDQLNSTITQSVTNTEHMEISATDSSDSTEAVNESRLTRRSIRVPLTNNNEARSRSISIENKREIMSTSEENLSEKNK